MTVLLGGSNDPHAIITFDWTRGQYYKDTVTVIHTFDQLEQGFGFEKQNHLSLIVLEEVRANLERILTLGPNVIIHFTYVIYKLLK
jgi:hypothetical protein